MQPQHALPHLHHQPHQRPPPCSSPPDEPTPSSRPPTPVTILERIHDRYMRIPEVSRWLMTRDTAADFHVVRNETAVLVTTGSNSTPQIKVAESVDLPFPSSDDLIFLDHSSNNIAYGHIWSNTQVNAHPFSSLAMSMHSHRWEKIRSRKFVSDLSVNGAVEMLEFTWYEDDSCTVSVTRSPFSSNTPLIRIALHMFYTPDDKPRTSLHQPAFALFTYDFSRCTKCNTEICTCADAVSPPHMNDGSFFVLRAKTPDGSPVTAHYSLKSWEDRQRLVLRGSKRGVTTIELNPFQDAKRRMSMRQEYFSNFQDSQAISARIEHHITHLLSKLPMQHPIAGELAMTSTLPGSSQSECPVNNGNAANTNCDTTSYGNDDACGKVPRSGSCADKSICCSEKSDGCGESAAPKEKDSFKHKQNRPNLPSTKDHSSYHSLAPLRLSSTGRRPGDDSSWQSSAIREGHLSSKAHSVSPDRGGIPSCANTQVMEPDAGNMNNNRLTNGVRDSITPFNSEFNCENAHGIGSRPAKVARTISSTCGPEKAGTDCECSAETIPNPALAQLLNPQNTPYSHVDFTPYPPASGASVIPHVPNVNSVGNTSTDNGTTNLDPTLSSARDGKDFLPISSASMTVGSSSNLDSTASSGGDRSTTAGGSSLTNGTSSNFTPNEVRNVSASISGSTSIQSPLKRHASSVPGLHPVLKRPKPNLATPSTITTMPSGTTTPMKSAGGLPLSLGSVPWGSSNNLTSEIKDKELQFSPWNLPERPPSALSRTLEASPAPLGASNQKDNNIAVNMEPGRETNLKTGPGSSKDLDFATFDLMSQMPNPGSSRDYQQQEMKAVSNGEKSGRSFESSGRKNGTVSDNEARVLATAAAQAAELETNQNTLKEKNTGCNEDDNSDRICDKSNEDDEGNSNKVGTGGVSCEICGITFAKRGNKTRHIMTVHNQVKQFHCDLCGAKFGLKADLGRHRFRIHESRSFACPTCGKSYAEKSQLEMHIKVTHEEDSKPWECKICHIRFGRKSSLTRHEQTVHQHTRFECRVCKKSYSQRFDAIRHERKVHGLNNKNGGAPVHNKSN